MHPAWWKCCGGHDGDGDDGDGDDDDGDDDDGDDDDDDLKHIGEAPSLTKVW